ncbi:hypothetical protein AB0N14_32345 [Streptomyces sp. NPDC051104]|uniref:hypothetical protein n=1 Tax=Streptomyces sp. NPDC051104 TaxID=3155044 RepID=UPI00342A0A10
MTALALAPARTDPGTSRTKRDRLEILHALIAAPTFDPLLTPDVIAVPGDHPVFGWACAVEDCGRVEGGAGPEGRRKDPHSQGPV